VGIALDRRFGSTSSGWNNHLRPPDRTRPMSPRASAARSGAVHGRAGFYTAKKFALAPEKLPPELHWFKWEAYSTLITGIFPAVPGLLLRRRKSP